MLDAAERVFVNVGFEAASTTLIAAEAGTSIGSTYHFFTDKEAIVDALAARYLIGLRATLGQHDEGRDGSAAIGGVVDAVAEFAGCHPGLGPLLQASRSSGHLVDLSHGIRTVLVEHLERLLTIPHSPADSTRRHTVATMCAALLRCLLEMLTAHPPEALVAETRLAIVAYVAAALPPNE